MRLYQSRLLLAAVCGVATLNVNCAEESPRGRRQYAYTVGVGSNTVLISSLTVSNSPDWNPDHGVEPPIAIGNAVQLAKRALASHLQEESLVQEVDIIPVEAVKWCYVVQFSKYQQPAFGESAGSDLSVYVPVTMSGAVVSNAAGVFGSKQSKVLYPRKGHTAAVGFAVSVQDRVTAYELRQQDLDLIPEWKPSQHVAPPLALKDAIQVAWEELGSSDLKPQEYTISRVTMMRCGSTEKWVYRIWFRPIRSSGRFADDVLREQVVIIPMSGRVLFRSSDRESVK